MIEFSDGELQFLDEVLKDRVDFTMFIGRKVHGLNVTHDVNAASTMSVKVQAELKARAEQRAKAKAKEPAAPADGGNGQSG